MQECWSVFPARRERIGRKRGLDILEDLVVDVLRFRLVIVEAISVNQFSLHLRLLVVLQLVKDLRVIICHIHLLLRL